MSKNVEINEEVIVADMNAILKIFFQTSMEKNQTFQRDSIGSGGSFILYASIIQLNKITFIATRIVSFLHF